jgi:hypothetical protein
MLIPDTLGSLSSMLSVKLRTPKSSADDSISASVCDHGPDDI